MMTISARSRAFGVFLCCNPIERVLLCWLLFICTSSYILRCTTIMVRGANLPVRQARGLPASRRRRGGACPIDSNSFGGERIRREGSCAPPSRHAAIFMSCSPSCPIRFGGAQDPSLRCGLTGRSTLLFGDNGLVLAQTLIYIDSYIGIVLLLIVNIC